MELQAGASYSLRNNNRQHLGDVLITRLGNPWVKGKFAPSAAFAEVRPVFAEFEELVNDQVFALVDGVAEKIDNMGLQVCAALQGDCVPVFDVQIMNEHDIAFKLRA